MLHTFIAMLQDDPDALTRTVSLLRRRGYRIESLAVGASERPGLTRLTLVVDVDNPTQVLRQLERLVDIVSVRDVTALPKVEREMAVVRLGAPRNRHAVLVALAEHAGARIAELAADAVILELTDRPEQVDRFLVALRPFGIREVSRSGRMAMARGGPPEPQRPIAANADPGLDTTAFHSQADGAGHHDLP